MAWTRRCRAVDRRRADRRLRSRAPSPSHTAWPSAGPPFLSHVLDDRTYGGAAAPPGRWRTGFLSAFGPLSLFVLVVLWAVGLIFGFALVHWSIGTALSATDTAFGTYAYFSGTTFFTLGYGDLVPTGTAGRVLSVAESGLGFVFLAVIVSYLPVLYQAFSRCETTIALLDARAGSPPTAAELAAIGGRTQPDRRRSFSRGVGTLGGRASGDSHFLSGPELLPSQHENQSWVATLTTILDTSALLLAGVDGPDGYQARLTFAMARHAAVDLALVSQTGPLPPQPDRLTDADFSRLRQTLCEAGVKMREGPSVAAALAELRGLYEPFVNALASHFLFAMPPFQPVKPPVDNWQTSPWLPRSPSLGGLAKVRADGHFD